MIQSQRCFNLKAIFILVKIKSISPLLSLVFGLKNYHLTLIMRILIHVFFPSLSPPSHNPLHLLAGTPPPPCRRRSTSGGPTIRRELTPMRCRPAAASSPSGASSGTTTSPTPAAPFFLGPGGWASGRAPWLHGGTIDS